MFLNDEEKRMLNGEMGIVPQKCMEYLQDEGEAAGAECLIDLDGTADFHTPMTAMSYRYQFGIEELRKLVESGARFKVPVFANKSPFLEGKVTCVHGWKGCGMAPHNEEEYHERCMQKEFMDLYRKMGMMTIHSCDYYLASTYWPTKGQHCAWNESSALPWVDAVLGARSNIDGNFASAFLGKAPAYGFHLDENRYATVYVTSQRTISTDLEYDLFGFAVGEECGLAVPAFANMSRPTTTQLLKLHSAMNTGGSIHMYHIPGTTPEAPDMEYAFHGQKPRQEYMVDDARLKKAYETLNYHTGDDVDMVSLGCPHMTVVDLMYLARKLEGTKAKVPFRIMTIPWLYHNAREQGYLEIFEAAGANLMTGTCPAAMGGVPEGVKVLAVDSAKQSYYITGRYPDDDRRLQVCYGTQDDCIEAALTGKWRGEWR